MHLFIQQIFISAYHVVGMVLLWVKIEHSFFPHRAYCLVKEIKKDTNKSIISNCDKCSDVIVNEWDTGEKVKDT